MADFLKAFVTTSGHEGGYVNDTTDRGGETYRGVARKKNPAWYGWEIVDGYKDDDNFPDSLDLDDDLQFRVEQFYKDYYWDANRLDDIKDQRIAEEIYDTGVNTGIGRAARMLQEALNFTNNNGRLYRDISVDGIIGPVTISLTNGHPHPGRLLKTLNLLQAEHYLNIMRRSTSQEKYLGGWFNRVTL